MCGLHWYIENKIDRGSSRRLLFFSLFSGVVFSVVGPLLNHHFPNKQFKSCEKRVDRGSSRRLFFSIDFRVWCFLSLVPCKTIISQTNNSKAVKKESTGEALGDSFFQFIFGCGGFCRWSPAKPSFPKQTI